MNSKTNHSKFTYKFYPRHSQTSLFNIKLPQKIMIRSLLMMNNCSILFLQGHSQISRREYVTYETNSET